VARPCPSPCWISLDNLQEGLPHVVLCTHNRFPRGLLVTLNSSDIHAETSEEAIPVSSRTFSTSDACDAISLGRYWTSNVFPAISKCFFSRDVELEFLVQSDSLELLGSYRTKGEGVITRFYISDRAGAVILIISLYVLFLSVFAFIILLNFWRMESFVSVLRDFIMSTVVNVRRWNDRILPPRAFEA